MKRAQLTRPSRARKPGPAGTGTSAVVLKPGLFGLVADRVGQAGGDAVRKRKRSELVSAGAEHSNVVEGQRQHHHFEVAGAVEDQGQQMEPRADFHRRLHRLV